MIAGYDPKRGRLVSRALNSLSRYRGRGARLFDPDGRPSSPAARDFSHAGSRPCHARIANVLAACHSQAAFRPTTINAMERGRF